MSDEELFSRAKNMLNEPDFGNQLTSHSTQIKKFTMETFWCCRELKEWKSVTGNTSQMLKFMTKKIQTSVKKRNAKVFLIDLVTSS